MKTLSHPYGHGNDAPPFEDHANNQENPPW